MRNPSARLQSWLINSFKNSIIKFKDRTEYKKNNQYHRLNGPAIDYENEKLDKYYYNGKLLEKDEWKKASLKDIRKIKIKKLNSESQIMSKNEFDENVDEMRQKCFHMSDEDAEKVIDEYLIQYPKLLKIKDKNWFLKNI